jgi:uncharacterized membrane protein YadS
MKTDFNFFRRHFYSELNCIVCLQLGIGYISQEDFGLWCAIAIHDTSSVVAAANKYGPQALQIATKLARALWIIPLL